MSDKHAEVTERELMTAEDWLSRMDDPTLKASGATRMILAALIADDRAEVERKARLDEANEMPHDSACREGEWNPLTRDTNNCDCYKSRRIAELEREGQ